MGGNAFSQLTPLHPDFPLFEVIVDSLEKIYSYLEANGSRFEEDLTQLLRIPSVSADSQFAGDVRQAADWLKNHLDTMD